MKKAFVFGLLLLGQSFYSQAQKKWTLQECISFAEQNNVQLKINQVTIDGNELSYNQSKKGKLPTLNGNTSVGYNLGRSIDPFSNEFTQSNVASSNLSLNGSMTLYNGKTVRNTYLQNEMNLEKSKLDKQTTYNNISLSIANAYLSILLNKELLENAKTNLKTIQEQIKRTKVLIEAGSLAKNSLYDFESQKANAEMQIVRFEGAILTSETQLRQSMQYFDEEKMDFAVPQMGEPDKELNMPSALEVYTNAELEQPQIKATEYDIKSSQLGIKLAEANKYPTLSLQASASTGYSSLTRRIIDGSGNLILVPIGATASGEQVFGSSFSYQYENTPLFSQFNQNFRQYIGLNLSIPIYNRGQVKTSIKQAQVNLKRAELNAELQKNQLRQNIQQSYVDLITAQKNYWATAKTTTALKATLDVVKQRYEAGSANATDLTVATNNLQGAQSDLIRMKYDFFFKKKILEFYEGKKFDF